MPLTRWSLVVLAADESAEKRLEALNELLEVYRPVLKNYLVRSMGISAPSADDIVQQFMAERVMGKNALYAADRGKGRFRNYLLQSFRNFVISQTRRESARKRTPDASGHVSLSEYPDLVAQPAEMESAFNVAWAQQTIAETVERVRQACALQNRLDVWEVFDHRLLGPILYGKTPIPHAELATRYNFKSPEQVANVLLTVKRMFRRMLVETVRDTVADDTDVDAEIEALKHVLASVSGQVHRIAGRSAQVL